MTESDGEYTPINELLLGDTVVLSGLEWGYHGIRGNRATVTNVAGTDGYFVVTTEDGADWYVDDEEYHVIKETVSTTRKSGVRKTKNGHVGIRTATEEEPAPLEQWEIELIESPEASLFRDKVQDVLKGLENLLVEKNKSYGNSALDPVRAFSKVSTQEQIRVRIDDKLSRLIRGKEFNDEDTVNDLIGYLVLLKIVGDENA